MPVRRVLVALVVLAPLAAAVPLGGPVATFEDAEAWFPEAWLVGLTYAMDACATDATLGLQQLSLEGRPRVLYYDGGGSTCLRVEGFVPPRTLDRPRTLGGEVFSEDMEGGWTVDEGRVRILLLPTDPTRIEGFPDLASVVVPRGPSLAFTFVLSPEGDVRGYRWSVGGETLGDTLTTTPLRVDDVHVDLLTTVGGGRAEVVVSGNGIDLAWAGLVRQDGPRWWHLAPIDDSGEARAYTWEYDAPV